MRVLNHRTNEETTNYLSQAEKNLSAFSYEEVDVNDI